MKLVWWTLLVWKWVEVATLPPPLLEAVTMPWPAEPPRAVVVVLLAVVAVPWPLAVLAVELAVAPPAAPVVVAPVVVVPVAVLAVACEPVVLVVPPVAVVVVGVVTVAALAVWLG